MSAPNAKDLEGLRKKVDATIKAQECVEDMGTLMRTPEQEMQAKLVALYGEKDFRDFC
jgi:hypothetical protein